MHGSIFGFFSKKEVQLGKGKGKALLEASSACGRGMRGLKENEIQADAWIEETEKNRGAEEGSASPRVKGDCGEQAPEEIQKRKEQATPAGR